ncbi:MAG TPA: hypothetical protein VEI58_09445 [Chthoniobacterales bacterium]|nr:hypothetical protein [Chthoniobacterales bacterium]
MEISETPSDMERRNSWIAATVAILAATVFCVSIKPRHQPFDYTFRIASILLHGHAGLQTLPPSWLNEMVPRDGRYYSVFPLGAVLSVVPVAALRELGLISDFPARGVAGTIAGLCAYFFFHLSMLGARSLGRRILLALFPIFGTWTWCNLGFAGAWQIALGFALLGEVGALYFTLVRPRPLAAGAFFALAFGNRTELFLVLPIFLCLWLRRPSEQAARWSDLFRRIRECRVTLLQFLIVPAALGLLTAAYNFARFHSIFDFGYSHIPNLLREPWYRHGVFSTRAIRWNVHKMLFEGFGDNPHFPFIQFYPFGCSIFLASPFLCLIFREGGSLRGPAWIAIALLAFALWCHGNPGGWEFSYRYAIILVPWMFLLIVTNGPPTFSVIELALFIVSVAINALATYEFLWTDNIRP